MYSTVIKLRVFLGVAETMRNAKKASYNKPPGLIFGYCPQRQLNETEAGRELSQVRFP